MRTLTLGFDGTPESEAAGEWAAREAVRSEARLRVVYAWEWQPYSLTLMDAGTERRWVESLPRTEAATLASHHPDLDVVGERVSGPPVSVLLPVADDSETLVLGSRALGGLHGFVIGSVAQSVVAHATLPVVLVRAPEAGSDADPNGAEETGEVLVGVDLEHPDDDLLAPAFTAAERRGVRLHVLHCGRLPRGARGAPTGSAERSGAGTEPTAEEHAEEDARLTAALEPWRRDHPEVEVVAETCAGRPAERLVHASENASLLVVGRRSHRHTPWGPRIGHVTHAAMHHARSPVLVVPRA
ncbi:universal stress protein [Streptomyces sp. NPDC059740]|uniref:universal stress protein n=1 Tax=Streptomyces sp. NPDC059740 TaxID=3346926 RepID=UPI00365A64F4